MTLQKAEHITAALLEIVDAVQAGIYKFPNDWEMSVLTELHSKLGTPGLLTHRQKEIVSEILAKVRKAKKEKSTR